MGGNVPLTRWRRFSVSGSCVPGLPPWARRSTMTSTLRVVLVVLGELRRAARRPAPVGRRSRSLLCHSYHQSAFGVEPGVPVAQRLVDLVQLVALAPAATRARPRRPDRPGSGTTTAPRPRPRSPCSARRGSGSAVTHGAPRLRTSPATVRWCSEALKSSSARSTFTSAVVGTARTWRGSCGCARGRPRAGPGGSSAASGGASASAASGAIGSGAPLGGCGASGGAAGRAAAGAPAGAGRGRASRRGPTRGSSPACSARTKHSSHTAWRSPPGAR